MISADIVYWIIAGLATLFVLIQILIPTWQFFSVWRAASSFPSPPKTSWFTGHASYFTLDESSLKWRRSLWKFGKVINLQQGATNVIHATHPDTAKSILQRAGTKDVPLWKYIGLWLGEGLATSKGRKWERKWKMITPAFHFNVLRTYVPIFQKCFQKLMTEWSLESENGKSIEVSKRVRITTLECTMDCAFGEDGLTEMEQMHMIEETKKILSLVVKRMFSMLYYFDFIYKRSADGRAMMAAVNTYHGYCLKVIDNCKKKQTQQNASNLKSKKVLTFIENTLQAIDDDGKGLSTQEILDEVGTFMFAGTDTTASAIPFCLYYLAKYTNWQETCRQEINDVIGNKADITWEDLSALQSTTMFIKECLRVANPLTQVTRRTTENILLKDGRIIPKGTQVGALIETVHHNPDVWESPEVFDPLRFSPENADKRPAYAFLAFSAGPRNCIGQSFAMTQIRVAIVMVLKKFRLKLDDAKPMKMTIKGIRGVEDGMWLKMEHI